MQQKASPFVVVTSIAPPNAVLMQLAADCLERGYGFIVIGDVKSPPYFELDGCDFYSISRQLQLPFSTAASCPQRHYARKNIGYLVALASGASQIVETDDDNVPRADFYTPLKPRITLPVLENTGWVNIYRYFSDAVIWPRGLPLDAVNAVHPALSEVAPRETYCPIQQGLADENPDVDAIYRLLLPLPQNFRKGVRVATAQNAWCPFNSQNTVWFPDAYPLLYLPSYCSFRMTDIWRSFVAQRIAWANGWSILFREATVSQLRNEHRLMKDFEDEIPGYVNNRRIGEVLEELDLKPGTDGIPDNLRLSYEALVKLGVVGEQELPLLEAWLADLAQIRGASKSRDTVQTASG
ncbi:MAG TPA: STELLO glycosyltransferase family protein [Gemmatimonadaceae bacterium]|nr:STELLO glycosyltransferase family protein [Gemmatimonadaceae bacterium]